MVALAVTRWCAVGERDRLGQPDPGAVVAAPGEVDVAELGAGLGHRLPVVASQGDVIRGLRGGHPFLVEPAEGMNKCLGEHQAAVTRSPGSPARSARRTAVRRESAPVSTAPAETAARPSSSAATHRG